MKPSKRVKSLEARIENWKRVVSDPKNLPAYRKPGSLKK